MKKKEIKKIVFYSGIPRNFRTTLIGHLYELSQVYPVVLLSEELDRELKKVLKDKKLFPKLEKIIPVHQYAGPKMNIFKKNRYLSNIAKRVIDQHKPDVVVAPHDIYPFEMYLFRFAKKIGAITFAVQEGNVMDVDSIRKRVDLVNAHLRLPEFMPLFIRSFFVQLRKYSGHLLYYWLLPISVGEKPFFGRSSYILRKGISGMRDADYRIVFSRRDHDIHARAGVPLKKLYILSHPLKRDARDFFKRTLFNKSNYKTTNKTVTLLFAAAKVGFRRKDCSFISEKERFRTNMETVSLINNVFKNWKIYIKPHPLVENFNELKKASRSISSSIKVVNPSESIDKYIKMSKVIIELPLSISTALYSASLLSPEKAILSLDLNKELAGDFYKDFKGVEYVDNKDELIQILDSIKRSKFRGKLEKEDSRTKKFSNLVELLNLLVLEEA